MLTTKQLCTIVTLLQILCEIRSFDMFKIRNRSGIVFRIYNGERATLGQFPYQIGFKSPIGRKEYFTFCGGTLVRENKIISATHCFENQRRNACHKCCGTKKLKPINDIYAVAALLNNYAFYSEKEGQWRKLKSVIAHPKYKFPANDIAIVITEPFTFNNLVNKIPVASKFVEYEGKCIASGYGRISNTVKSAYLQWAEMDVISIAKANRIFGINTRNFVCISGRRTDAGQGDSGGPLICKDTGDPAEGPSGVLVGVACARKDKLGSVFTRVSHFTDFIASASNTIDNCYVLIFIAITINSRF